ncbi:MAG: hypothetical protein ACI9CA_002048 [Natronomonas sp.]|jgi:hypothetical protein
MSVNDATDAPGPDLPDGWVQSTGLPDHETFLHADGPLDGEERRRGLVLLADSGRARWRVVALVGYPDRPHLAAGVDYDTAVETVEEEIAAVEAGEPATEDDDVRPPEERETNLRQSDGEEATAGEQAGESDESDESGEQESDGVTLGDFQ